MHFGKQLIRNRLGRRLFAIGTACAIVLVFVGCAHVPKDLGITEVQTQTLERTGSNPQWFREEDIAATLPALLDKPLTPDSAVQIALLRNPEVAIIFAELGLSRADLIEAGTLPNPSLGGMARFGVGAASGTMLDLDGGFPLIDALMLPLRKKIEERYFEQAKLRAADRLLGLVAQVRAAWFDAVSAQQELGIVASSLDAATAAAELARRQYQAGNLSRLELLSQETLEVQTRLEARELQAGVAAKEQELRRVLGLRPEDPEWMLMPVLVSDASATTDPTSLEAAAIEQRLDLAAAAFRVTATEQGLRLAKRFRFTGLIDVGVSAEREPEGDWFVGPSVDLELPIFNRSRGNIMRFEAQLAMALAERDATQAKVRAEVQTAAAALQSAAERVTDYDTVLLPLHRELLEQTLLHYNGMLLGVYDLLNAKRMDLEAQRGAVHARLDYWLARIDLERAIAGPLPDGDTAAATKPESPAEAPAKQTETTHEEHKHSEE